MMNGSPHTQISSHHTGGPSSANIINGPMPSSSSSAAGQSSSISAPAAAVSVSPFDSLEQKLEIFIENARHICVIVSDFQGAPGNSTSTSNASQATSSTTTSQNQNVANQQAVLNEKLHTLVFGLQELDQAKHHFQETKIPFELFDQYIDAGRNPQLYTKECMERTLNKNKKVNGKIQLYKKFRAHLLKELTDEFPKEAMQYRAIREQTMDVGGSSSNSGVFPNGTTPKQEPS